MATTAAIESGRSIAVTATGLLTLLLGSPYAALGGWFIWVGASWAEQVGGDPWAPVATLFGLGPALIIALGVAFLPLALLGLAAGCGVLYRRRWGRTLTFTLAALALLLGLVWVGGGDGDAIDLVLGGGQILYGVIGIVVLTRKAGEFSSLSHTTAPVPEVEKVRGIP